MKGLQVSTLQWTVARHLDRMSTIVCGRQDAVPQLGREVAFLKALTAYVWQGTDCEWELARIDSLKFDPKRQPVQVWQYDRDMERFQALVCILTEKGVLQKARAAEDSDAADFLAGEEGVEAL